MAKKFNVQATTHLPPPSYFFPLPFLLLLPFFLSFSFPSCPSSLSFFVLLHTSKKMTTMGNVFTCHSYLKVATIDVCRPHKDDFKEVGNATCQGLLAQLLAT